MWGAPETVHKDGQHDSASEVKPKSLDQPLLAECSIGHKSRLLHVSGWDMSQTKKYSSDTFFQKMVSVILVSLYHTDVCSSVNFLDMFGFS